MDISDKQVRYILLNNLKEKLIQLFNMDKSSSRELFHYFCRVSYIHFWEIVKGDTQIIKELESVGIPCSKDIRNSVAHADSTYSNENFEKFFLAFTSQDFDTLILNSTSDILNESIKDLSINGSYNATIESNSFS